MKRKRIQRDEIASRLFSLTDQGVEFRNQWRGIVGAAIWLVLSGITMILTIIGVTERLHILILIAMSFLKYVPLLVVVYSLARKMASRYLDDVFELDDEDLASSFLEDVTFGYGREKITINEGKIPEADERSPIILIGGPGHIQVNLDSVALVEKVNGEPRVIYPRKDSWVLGRFDRIREIGKFDEVGKREYAIINLRDQFVSGLSVKSRTKDGIPIEAQGIKVIFSILRKQATDEETVLNDDAYLFDEHAVRTLVYGQTIITPEPSVQSGISFPWNTSVIPLITSEMEKMINSRTLSEILATISQKEVDLTSNNEATIAQMRLEMTGEQRTTLSSQDKAAPSFQSRSKITALFFDDAFKEKAANIGVSIQWIDVGTWQLPSPIILEKHKEALDLSQKNVSKRNEVERSKKRHQTAEIVSLIDHVVISNFERASSGRGASSWAGREKEISNKEILKQIEGLIAQRPELKEHLILDEDANSDIEATLASFRPEIKNQIVQQATSKKDAANTAREILKAFRKELINAKDLIEKENRSQVEKNADLARINKALYDINQLTFHYIK